MRDNFLSAMRLLSTAAIGLLSVACVADDGDGKVVRTTSDAILGKADWKNIEMTDSSISIVGDTGLPIRWQKMELPNTFLELMAFENGSIRYQKVYGGLYLEEYESDLDKMRETYDFSKLRERYSLDFDESNVKRKSYGFGDIRYISLASESSG
ncbi:MAG: hypothetical protein HYV05_00195, partial [Deltaproteobacteria bacterium]|nr:hypothetical protein [Deltaproteobacteria bacterium]